MSEVIKSVFIVEPFNLGWIIEKLMRDIALQLRNKGIEVTIGSGENYNKQQVVLHSRYLYIKPIKSAIINSTFVTHIDDKLKEYELKKEFTRMDSFICMSPHEKDVLVEMGCPAEKVVGISLPHRGGFVRRPKICIFSARYSDGRKNESWIIEYLESKPKELRNNFILCFIGYNWERICEKLSALGASYELYRYDRSMPGEYEAQKKLLENMDYMIYPGFDSGAMCVYDGLLANTQLLIADNGFHRGLSEDTYLFKDKKEFFSSLDSIVKSVESKDSVISDRSIESYVEKLLKHWASLSNEQNNDEGVINETVGNDIAEYRKNYKNITFRRLLSTLYRTLKKNI